MNDGLDSAPPAPDHGGSGRVAAPVGRELTVDRERGDWPGSGVLSAPQFRAFEAQSVTATLGAAAPPLPRWRSGRAELPALRARLKRAEECSDVDGERRAAAALARALVERGSELDIAVRLARRAVLLGDDSLRVELSGWHCQLGQTALAVGMLTPLIDVAGAERSRLLMRIALYWARLGEAEHALSALREAQAQDSDDPLVHELQAMVHGWAPESTSARQAAEAYLSGAQHRQRRGERSQAFEDVLRAFDTAPENEASAEALSRALAKKTDAPARVDEVLRRHADALIRTGQFERGREVHHRRMRTAIARGELHGALAAALDARLDASLDAETLLSVAACPLASVPVERRGFDWLLLELGLHELFAARLQLAGEVAVGPLASQCFNALGHFLEQRLGSVERALDAWVEAAYRDPDQRDAFASLRAYAEATGDYGPLVESLIRVGLVGDEASRTAAVAALRELSSLVEERALDAALGSWAERRAAELAGTGSAFSSELAAEDGDWGSEYERELEALEGERRVPILRLAAAALQSRPDRPEPYRAVLWELTSRRPDELRWHRLLERLLTRMRDSNGLSRLWTRDLASAADDGRVPRALSGLSRLERSKGDLQGALSVLAADDVRGRAPAAAVQLCLAAQLDNGRLRAEGLLKYAHTLAATPRAWLASVASGSFAELGELASALSAAEVGTRADPTLIRPVVAYANAATGRRDRVAAVALERAIAATFPSSQHCRGLVSVLEELGEPYAAQVWTGRWLGLRPAETQAATQLLAGAARAGDAARLGDVMSWAVSQAHPLAGWEEPLAAALSNLAECDSARAGDIAWQLLDAFGPSSPCVLQAVRFAADRAGDLELQIAAFERELAADGASTRDVSLWNLATLHAERGDTDRCCAVLSRGLAAGVDADPSLTLLRSLGETQSAEGEFHRLQVQACAYQRLDPASDERWHAARQYGAALWDLARDPGQAVAVWLAAAEDRGPRAWFSLARDLIAVSGLERALDEVCRLAESRQEPAQAAALLTGAAVACHDAGQQRRARELGLRALDVKPTSVVALDVIEAVSGAGDVALVEGAYQTALAATLGRYGARALHYRASRFFERLGDRELALNHVLAAFRAVPSEGVTFALMLRLAQALGEGERACRVVEEVAEADERGFSRSQWLRRAASLAGEGADGAQHRVQVLLRALRASPEVETVDLLGRAFTDLARLEPDGRALGRLSFGSAVANVIPTLESIEGARVAIAMASLALSCFADSALCLQALEGAVELDPDTEDFSERLADAARLADESAAAGRFLRAVQTHTRDGVRGSDGLLELAAEVAAGLGREAVAAGLLTRRLQRSPEDDALRERIERLIQSCRGQQLPDHVVECFPEWAEQARWVERAESARAEGDSAAELSALERAARMGLALPTERVNRTLQLAGRGGGQAEVAQDALRAARGLGADPELLLSSTRSLAASLIEHRHPVQALRLLREACASQSADVSLLSQTLAAARAAGDDEARRQVLDALIASTGNGGKKGLWLNEAWELAKQSGHSARATELLHRWLEVDAEDTRALSRLEEEYEGRRAWPELAELLGRHLRLDLSLRERRRLVLRRCELLENELGRLEEAREQLSELVEQAPADCAVVQRLARVTEQLGHPAAAAECWLTASGLSSTRPAAAQLAERACRLFLDAEDQRSARRVLAAPQTVPRTLGLAELEVRLERDDANQPRLARALEGLAEIDEQSASDRAAALLEAANIWRRLSDDERACQCASSAASLVPDDADAQILASYLEYQRRGPRGTDEAARTVERLRPVLDGSPTEQLDLAGFLLAEALDQTEGGNLGLESLQALSHRIGATPLVSVGLAERLARSERPVDALEHFDAALRASDLHGLRTTSELALAAGRVAQGTDLLGRAHRYAKVAETDPKLEAEVGELRARLNESARSSGIPAADVTRARGPAVHVSWSRRPSRGLPARAASAGSEAPEDTRPARRTQVGLGRMKRVEEPADTQRQVVRTDLGPPPPDRPLPDALVFSPADEQERALEAALEEGDSAAGTTLVQHLLAAPHRAVEAVAVALQLLRFEPGSSARLALLRQAAEASGDAAYASAVAHAAGCLDSADSVPSAGPLELQPIAPERLRALLFDDAHSDTARALEVIWQATRRVFDGQGGAGVEQGRRSSPPEDSKLAPDHQRLARRLGLAETPLMHWPHGTPSASSVVMGGQARVLWVGERGASRAEMLYDLGAALAGTLPAHAVVSAATEAQLDELFCAVSSAFGPTEAGGGASHARAARLAAALWESVPARTQRYMTEWCASGAVSQDVAVAAARRAARRAGLFASADVRVALGRLRTGASRSRASHEPPGLSALCQQSTEAADLLLLACDPAFARLRWQGVGRCP